MAATTNVQGFVLGLAKASARNRERHARLTVAVALEALRRVILTTRVDTGRLRGNWQVAEGQPPQGVLDRLDAAGSEGAEDTLAIEARKVQALSGREVIWLHNGLDYAAVWEREDKMVAGTAEALRVWIASGALR